MRFSHILIIFSVGSCLAADHAPQRPRLLLRKHIEVPFFGVPVESARTKNENLRVDLENLVQKTIINARTSRGHAAKLELEMSCSMRSPFINDDLNEIWFVIWKRVKLGRMPEALVHCFTNENKTVEICVYSIKLEKGRILDVTGVNDEQIKVIVQSPIDGSEDNGFGYYSGRVNKAELVGYFGMENP